MPGIGLERGPENPGGLRRPAIGQEHRAETAQGLGKIRLQFESPAISRFGILAAPFGNQLTGQIAVPLSRFARGFVASSALGAVHGSGSVKGMAPYYNDAFAGIDPDFP